MSDRSPGRGLIWAIHGAALVVPCAIYWMIFGEFWTSDSFGSFAGGLAMVFLVLLIAYAIGTTVAVALAGRRATFPLVLHGLAFTAVTLFWWYRSRDQWAAEGELAAVAAGKQALAVCLHVSDIRVTPGARMHATLTLHNGCADAVSLRKVWLAGNDSDGGVRSMATPQPMSALAPGQTLQVALEPMGIPSTHSDDGLGWSWTVDIDVDADFDAPVTETNSFLVCYGTPDAHANAECGKLPPVTVEPVVGR